MSEIDPEIKRVVLALLTRGEITLAEAAKIAGVSRQLARKWVQSACIPWQRTRWHRITVRVRKLVDRPKR